MEALVHQYNVWVFRITDEESGMVKQDNNLYPQTPEEDLFKEGGEYTQSLAQRLIAANSNSTKFSGTYFETLQEEETDRDFMVVLLSKVQNLNAKPD